MIRRLKGHWHKIGLVRKCFESVIILLLLLSINPANAVRFSVLTDGEPEIAVKCKPYYEDDEESFFPGTVVARIFFPVYSISPYRYMGLYNYYVNRYQIYRILIFTIAVPKMPVG